MCGSYFWTKTSEESDLLYALCLHRIIAESRGGFGGGGIDSGPAVLKSAPRVWFSAVTLESGGGRSTYVVKYKPSVLLHGLYLRELFSVRYAPLDLLRDGPCRPVCVLGIPPVLPRDRVDAVNQLRDEPYIEECADQPSDLKWLPVTFQNTIGYHLSP